MAGDRPVGFIHNKAKTLNSGQLRRLIPHPFPLKNHVIPQKSTTPPPGDDNW